MSAEVLATEHKAMIEEAESLYRLNKAKVIVKIPMGEEGLKAVKVLSEKKIRTNMTLIFFATSGDCWLQKLEPLLFLPLWGRF